MEYRVQTVNMLDFLFPEAQKGAVIALFQSFCEEEEEHWIIRRGESDILSINKTDQTFSDEDIPDETNFASELSYKISLERFREIRCPRVFGCGIYAGFDKFVYRPEELYDLADQFLHLPQCYVFDAHLWSRKDVVRGISFGGKHFLDIYTQYYGRGPYLDFRVMENPEMQVILHDMTTVFARITDNVIEDWYRGGLFEIITFSYANKQMNGITRYGITNVPKESVKALNALIRRATPEHYINVARKNYEDLCALLDMAELHGLSVVVDGV